MNFRNALVSESEVRKRCLNFLLKLDKPLDRVLSICKSIPIIDDSSASIDMNRIRVQLLHRLLNIVDPKLTVGSIRRRDICDAVNITGIKIPQPSHAFD